MATTHPIARRPLGTSARIIPATLISRKGFHPLNLLECNAQRDADWRRGLTSEGPLIGAGANLTVDGNGISPTVKIG